MHIKSELPTSIIDQITTSLVDIEPSRKMVNIVCGCGSISSTSLRNLKRKWADRDRYLCKSCHVKTYVNDTERIEKYKDSMSKLDLEYLRSKRSEAGSRAWSDKEKADDLKRKITQDNKNNPLKAKARAKALEALQSKSWFSSHMRRMNQKSIEHSRSNTDQFVDKAKSVHGEKYDYDQAEYITNNKNLTIICPLHGPFEQTPHNHLQGKGCRKCKVIISKQHELIRNLIPESIQIIDNETTLIKPYEIDIYLPKHRLGIEINGEYWHGINKYHNALERHKYKYRHSSKAHLAQEQSIKLLQFWCHEIENNINLVRSIILHSMGLSQRIHARKCQIKYNIDLEDFFDLNHLQGHRSASVEMALEFEDKIVAAVSFSKHPKYEWEIIRYACSAGTTVVGGFQKLLKHFITSHRPNTIMTFADRRISQNNLYLKAGFVPLKITDPNYFYIKGKYILSRQQCQKHKLHKILPSYDPSISETDNLLLNNYSKVYDAGHYQSLFKTNLQ